MVLKHNLQKALKKTLKKTNVWKNDYQIYRLNGSGQLSQSSTTNSKFFGHVSLITSRDDLPFKKIQGNLKASIMKSEYNPAMSVDSSIMSTF